jgi:hypothetical protein
MCELRRLLERYSLQPWYTQRLISLRVLVLYEYRGVVHSEMDL